MNNYVRGLQLTLFLCMFFATATRSQNTCFEQFPFKFEVLSEEDRTVSLEIPYENEDFKKEAVELILPSEVEHEGVAYTVTEIASVGIVDMPQLTGLTIPPTVERIGVWGLSICPSLESLHIPASVIEIGQGGISECPNLTDIVVDDNNPAFSSDGMILYNKDKTVLRFYPSAKGDVVLPEGIMEIGRQNSSFGTFYRNEITSVTIPSTVQTLHYGIFVECPLKKVICLPTTPPKILPYDMFVCDEAGDRTDVILYVPHESLELYRKAWPDYARQTTSIEFPDEDWPVPELPDKFDSYPCTYHIISKEDRTLEALGYYGDYTPMGGGTNDYDIIFPETVSYGKIPDYTLTRICEKAFRGHRAFYVQLPGSLREIESEAFSYMDRLETVRLPGSLEFVEGNVFIGCRNLTGMRFDSENLFFDTEGSILFTKDGKMVISYPSASGEVELPEGVELVGANAMRDTGITALTLPSTLGRLHETALWSCPGLERLVCLSVDPPEITGDRKRLFMSSYGEELVPEIYVPAASYELYREAPGWKNYLGHMLPMDSSGVGAADLGEDPVQSFEVFTADGRFMFRTSDRDAVNSLDKGIYVVNGTKVLVR